MRPLRIVVALLFVAGGIAAGLLALDVRAWRDELAAADARFEVGGTDESWLADERLPQSPAARLLGVEDDRRTREALLRFRRAYALVGDQLRRQEAEGARGEAERALARVAAAGSRAAASQASVLLGVLGFDQPQGPERAVTAFENALRLDGSNAAAKYDLELALRVLLAGAARPGDDGSGRESGPRAGAGAGELGGGY